MSDWNSGFIAGMLVHYAFDIGGAVLLFFVGFWARCCRHKK